MSIKPVDLQVMLPRISEAAKMHSDDQNKNQSMQQQQANLIQQKADHGLRQVHQQDKTPNAQVKERQEKNQKQQKEGKKEGRKEEEDKNSSRLILDSTSTFDIKV